jgi:plastocyanin
MSQTTARRAMCALMFILLSGCAGLGDASNELTAAAAGPAAAPAPASVAIQDDSYAPSTIRVKAGTTVIFSNRDSAKHSVTANNHSFGSPNLFRGSVWKHTFNEAGVHKYYCRFHSYMHGTIVVTK